MRPLQRRTKYDCVSVLREHLLSSIQTYSSWPGAACMVRRKVLRIHRHPCVIESENSERYGFFKLFLCLFVVFQIQDFNFWIINARTF